ncbi:HTH domain-containing protein [Magnetococcus sp. PR-3]|uniref:HTH domain-containing protein n=1 Tax=Magnetococcus sp. PR-3 TaxID=3120355 RepID=UPI002FCE5F7D
MVAAGEVSRAMVFGQPTFTLAEPNAAGEMPQLTERQEQAVALTQKHGRITRQELATEQGISIRTASREITVLVAHGAIVSDGRKGRLAGYHVQRNRSASH